MSPRRPRLLDVCTPCTSAGENFPRARNCVVLLSCFLLKEIVASTCTRTRCSFSQVSGHTSRHMLMCCTSTSCESFTRCEHNVAHNLRKETYCFHQAATSSTGISGAGKPGQVVALGIHSRWWSVHKKHVDSNLRIPAFGRPLCGGSWKHASRLNAALRCWGHVSTFPAWERASKSRFSSCRSVCNRLARIASRSSLGGTGRAPSANSALMSRRH